MTRRLTFIAVACCGGFCLTGRAASERSAPPATGLNAYKIILERNVFDPKRRPVRENVHQPPPPARPPDPTVIDLQGIYIANGKPEIFVAANHGNYGGTFAVGDQVAGFAIVAINTHEVALKKNGETLEWKAGTRLTDNGTGRWTLDKAPPPPVQSAAPAQPTPAAGSTNPSAMLKLLAERRKRALGK